MAVKGLVSSKAVEGQVLEAFKSEIAILHNFRHQSIIQALGYYEEAVRAYLCDESDLSPPDAA